MTTNRRTVLRWGAAALAAGWTGLMGSALAAENNTERMMMKEKLKIEVESLTFTAILADNATTRALVKRLPLEIDFALLYGRELCYRFPDALPVDDVRDRGYDVGEIVYWPLRHSFVILFAQNGERFAMQSIGKLAGDWSKLPKRDFRSRLRVE